MNKSKLVRDKIPEIIESKGEEADFHVANDKEYLEKLREKLHEEVDEFLKTEEMEELADILEVIYAICDLKEFRRERLEKLRKEKVEERGAFKERMILEE